MFFYSFDEKLPSSFLGLYPAPFMSVILSDIANVFQIWSTLALLVKRNLLNLSRSLYSDGLLI